MGPMIMKNDPNTNDIPWIIETKFEPNRPRLDLVRRKRLIEQLDEAATKKLGLIIAPAGYGKSSLLGQWAVEAEARNLGFAWLTLESSEADEKQFLAYVVLALSRLGVGLGELPIGARDGFADASTEAVLSKLIRSLNELNQRVVLIFEDYHSAECDAVNNIVKRLVRETTSNLTIFIDSRHQPQIDGFSLIASGEAIEIGATQLRLTQDETIEAFGRVADEASAIDIHKKTEGWPVAVQLAMVQKRAQPGEPILSGVDGGFVASYLTEQILSTLDPAAQELLLSVAFLERFNPELTNYVLQSEEAWGRIDQLSSFAALIVPLDVSGRWYRLHHLFAEYLRDLQIKKSQAQANVILLRASRWYSEQRQVVEAVRYAARGGDHQECERLILEAGGWKLILSEGIGVLRGALRLLPDNVIEASPRLLIARAYLHCKYGEIPEARAMLEASAQLMENKSPRLRDTDRLVVESMINLYEDRAEWPQDHARLREQYGDESDLDPLGRATIYCELVLRHLARAEFDQASDHLQRAFSLMRQSGSVLGLNYCYIHAAHIALYRGDFMVAAANIDRASKMADENFGSDSGLKAVASVLKFSLRVWLGELRRDDIGGFEDALAHTIENDGWVDLYMTGLAAMALLSRQCNDDAALAKAAQNLRLFSEQRGLERLAIFVQCAEKAGRASPRSRGGALLNMPSLIASYEHRAAPRDWQYYFWSACLASSECNIETAIGVLDPAINLAKNLGAGLWSLQLKSAKTISYLNAGQTEEAKSVLFDFLKESVSSKIIGPFLADHQILRLLNDLRADLRHDERELITLQFANHILETAKLLRPPKETGPLSEREHEVLVRLARGMSNKEIARSLEMTENTVKFHLKSLFSKLSVSKRTQAVFEAQKRGLID